MTELEFEIEIFFDTFNFQGECGTIGKVVHYGADTGQIDRTT